MQNKFQKIYKLTKNLFNQPKLVTKIIPYLVPFLHTDPKIRKIINKTCKYMLLRQLYIISKFFFFGGPYCLRYGFNMAHQNLIFPGIAFTLYLICFICNAYYDGQKNFEAIHLSQQAVKQISLGFYKHVLSLDPIFHFKNSQRTIIYKLNRSQHAIEQNMKATLTYFIPLFIDIIICLNVMRYFGWQLFLSYFLVLISYLIFTIKYSIKRMPDIKKSKIYQKEIDFFLSQTMANYYNIKFYNTQNIQVDRYKRKINQLNQISLKNQKTLAKLNFSQRVINGIGIGLNLILGVIRINRNQMTIGDLIMMNSLILQMVSTLFFLGSTYRNWNQAFIDFQLMQQIQNTQIFIKDTQDSKDYVQKQGMIEFRNLSFKYNKDQDFLIKNLNFIVDPGSLVAVIGNSGIGKSTLMSLIFRLFDLNQGEILLDGQNIKNLKIKSFRQRITVASQTPYLFNDTILNNLLYSNQKSNQEQIIQMCKFFGLHQKIMSLPDKYQSSVGEKGNLLSGGQKQRVSLIRSLMKKSKFYIFDEPTSSLDNEIESKVMKYIKNMKSTRIIVTHKLQLLQNVDKVLWIRKCGIRQIKKEQIKDYLDQVRIVEQF